MGLDICTIYFTPYLNVSLISSSFDDSSLTSDQILLLLHSKCITDIFTFFSNSINHVQVSGASLWFSWLITCFYAVSFTYNMQLSVYVCMCLCKCSYVLCEYFIYLCPCICVCAFMFMCVFVCESKSTHMLPSIRVEVREQPGAWVLAFLFIQGMAFSVHRNACQESWMASLWGISYLCSYLHLYTLRF